MRGRRGAECSAVLLALTTCAWTATASARPYMEAPAAPAAQPTSAPAAQAAPGTSPLAPSWPRSPVAPAGAPNILLVMTDDVGFAASSTFGGAIPTPALDRLASQGARYTAFHTNAICSATRAALLTGRNQHRVGFGAVAEIATGYPGYNATLPDNAAGVAEVLRRNGYNTAAFGKEHNVPPWEQSRAGPFDRWPTSRGFEYFYGFMGAETDQYHPKLFRGTTAVDEVPPADEMLDKMLVDDAIRWIHEQKASAPNKPFFLYLAPGTAHAPQQAPQKWIEQYKGRFDKGWDVLRRDIFDRQKALGVIPKNATLSPRPAQLPAWSSLTPEQREVSARYMEIYAAMLAYQDAQFGRLMAELDRMNIAKDTLVIFIQGDNGASGEGGPDGLVNEFQAFDPQPMPPEFLAKLGGPHSYQVYPAGWAWALNAPFPWMKQVGSHLGGTRNGMVLSWPGRIEEPGRVRPQFSHVIDIAPTLLEVAGITPPSRLDGVEQLSLDGTSLAYTFREPGAATRHQRQYFETVGNRAIYDGGWLASTTPRRMPWEFKDSEGDPALTYGWELYDLNKDFSQSRDLARQMPGKLAELKSLFDEEARKNQVYPLNDDFGMRRSSAGVQAYADGRKSFEYWGADISVPASRGPNLTARSFTVTAQVDLPEDPANGVVLASGSWFGGWSFYLDEGRPALAQAASQYAHDQISIVSEKPLGKGPATIEFAFEMDKDGTFGGAGTANIRVNGEVVAGGRIGRTAFGNLPGGETIDLGRDTGIPVTERYRDRGRFTGTIKKVVVSLP